MRLLFFSLFLGTFILACQETTAPATEKTLEEIKSDGPVSSIIRSPVTANGLKDTVNVAEISFEKSSYDFGEVREGDIVTYAFEFVNTGKVPLIISDARSSCGCTVPKWPEEPIAPGESNKIEVRFDTKNKKKQQNKSVTIMANTYPSKTTLALKGFVIAK